LAIGIAEKRTKHLAKGRCLTERNARPDRSLSGCGRLRNLE
jgi:hypothetical protein